MNALPDPNTFNQRIPYVAGLLKSLSHPNRLAIACALQKAERSVGEIEALTGIRQPSLSRELARLRDDGLVEARRQSKQIFYSLAPNGISRLLPALHAAFGASDDAHKNCADIGLGSDQKNGLHVTRPSRRLRIAVNPYREVLVMTDNEASRHAKTSPDVTAFFDPPTNTISYLVVDPTTNAAAIVDSVLDFDPNSGRTERQSADAIIAAVRKRGLRVEWLLETHVHADHLSAAPYLKQEIGGSLAIGSHIRDVQDFFGNVFHAEQEFKRDGSQFDVLFHDGDTFMLGAIEARAIHTPGHTPACMTFVIGDAAFVGDTIFMPDYGTARTDFPGGDARTLYRSVQKIFVLPDETRLFLCHDYLPEGRTEYRWETTVGEEKKFNIHIHAGVSEDEFVAMREARDKTLAVPRLILPSVQVNMRAGHFPPPEDDGRVYLKLPVNAF